MSDSIRIYLVRHGHAAHSWEKGIDAHLSDIGRRQAANTAQHMKTLGPLPVLTSPLRRARETAAAFETTWKITAEIDDGVSEIPSPVMETAARDRWLKEKMNGTWRDLRHESVNGETLGSWRERVLQTLLNLEFPTVVTTHYIAINAAVGAARGDDRVICFRPGNASCTILEIDNGALQLVQLGNEASTTVG